jgi:CRISPR-associated protein Csm5
VKYELKTITPIHIGTGERLSQIDGFYDNGRWHRIDIDAVLAASPESELNRLTIAMGQRGFQWQKYLPTDQPFARYVLPCPEEPQETEIREAIKNAFSRPMIPGSSIKGAIRTALLWDLISGDNQEAQEAFEYSVNDLKAQLRQKPNRSWAGQRIERRVLGKDPNHDLMRAVQVSDTAPIAVEALEMGVAWTVTLNREDQLVQKREGNREYKTFVEQIQAGQTLEFSIKIDKSLLRQREKRELGYSERQERVLCDDLAGVCNWVAEGLAKDESNFFGAYYLDEIASFYDTLLERIENLPDGAFILPVGWGTGYRAKTVIELLTEGENDLMMNLRQHYRLGESRSRRDYYHDEFPKTRRVLYHGQRPKSPLGWVQITPKT